MENTSIVNFFFKENWTHFMHNFCSNYDRSMLFLLIFIFYKAFVRPFAHTCISF